MAEYYQLPGTPRYHETDIRKLQDSDPASASTIFNPLIDMLLENTHFVKLFADALNTNKANSTHSHAAGDTISGLFDAARLPVVPVTKGGTGAGDAANARANLGITLTNLGAAAASHTHTPAQAGAAAASHTHDDRYYTETEVSNLLKSKAAASHTHTKAQITDMPAIASGTWASEMINAYNGGEIVQANNSGFWYRVGYIVLYRAFGKFTRVVDKSGTTRFLLPFNGFNWLNIQVSPAVGSNEYLYANGNDAAPWVRTINGKQLAANTFVLNTQYTYWLYGICVME